MHIRITHTYHVVLVILRYKCVGFAPSADSQYSAALYCSRHVPLLSADRSICHEEDKALVITSWITSWLPLQKKMHARLHCKNPRSAVSEDLLQKGCEDGKGPAPPRQSVASHLNRPEVRPAACLRRSTAPTGPDASLQPSRGPEAPHGRRVRPRSACGTRDTRLSVRQKATPGVPGPLDLAVPERHTPNSRSKNLEIREFEPSRPVYNYIR